MPELPGGPSEAAVEAAYVANGPRARENVMQARINAALAAAHDPVLGLDRSVNEAWGRADQTQRIAEWLRGDEGERIRTDALDAAVPPEDALADAIARKFGGGSDVD